MKARSQGAPRRAVPWGGPERQASAEGAAKNLGAEG